MKSKAIIKMYLIPTLLQITVIAALVGILKFRGFELGYNFGESFIKSDVIPKDP